MIFRISAVHSHRVYWPVMAMAGLGFLGGSPCTNLVRAAAFELDESPPSVVVGDSTGRTVSPEIKPIGSGSQVGEEVISSPHLPDSSSTASDPSGSWSAMIYDPVHGQSSSACTDCMPYGPRCSGGNCGHGHGPTCHPSGPDDAPGLLQFFKIHHDKKNTCLAFRADALLLWRNAPSSRPIYSTIVPDTDELGATALNASDLNSDVLAAPRLSLLRTDCDGHTLEATYLYAGNFYSERSLPFSPDGYATSPPGIFGNTWGPPDTSLDSAKAVLIGQLQSLELNSRHCIWGGMSQFLIGTRWLQWNETLQMSDSFFYAEPDPLAGKDFYETRCFNNLWGGQIGLDTLLLGRVGMSRVEGLIKAGAYYNAAGQVSSFGYAFNGGDTVTNQAQSGGPAACAFVGEVGLTAVLPITCSCDFRCGYSALWLANIAQPTKQLSDQQINQFDSVATLDTSGSVLLQGLSLGLESRW
jgi:hypothetical protein